MSKECEWCGCEIPYPHHSEPRHRRYQWHKRRFCSYSCTQRHRWARERENPKPREFKICEWCGEQYEKNESRSGWEKRRGCSISCGRKIAANDKKIDPLTRYTEDEIGCWIWTGPIGSNGYGVAADPDTGKSTGAHRVIYKLLVGEIPKGLPLDHLCSVRECVNPAHLEPVTTQENLKRMQKGICEREALMEKALKDGYAEGEVRSRGVIYRVTISAERHDK